LLGAVLLPASSAAAASTAAAAKATTTTTAVTTTTAAEVRLLRLPAATAIRATGRRGKAFLLKERLLAFGECETAAAIYTIQGLIGHSTALLQWYSTSGWAVDGGMKASYVSATQSGEVMPSLATPNGYVKYFAEQTIRPSDKPG
jgi:hypothetical protein